MCNEQSVRTTCTKPNIIWIFPLITRFQHGFLGGKSVETQLIQVYNHIQSMLESSGQIDIIYLDVSNACDSVLQAGVKHWCMDGRLARAEYYLRGVHYVIEDDVTLLQSKIILKDLDACESIQWSRKLSIGKDGIGIIFWPHDYLCGEVDTMLHNCGPFTNMV